jgi:ATP-binding cassette subfamily B protein
MVFQTAIRAPIAAVWAFSYIYGSNILWTSAVSAAIGLMVAMTAVILYLVMPKFKMMQILTDDITRVTRENLTGLRVVRAYNAEDYQETKFDTANERITDTQMFTGRVMASTMPLMNIIFTCLPLSIHWIGANLINNAGQHERVSYFGDLMVFSTYSMHIVMAFMMFAMMFVFMPRGSVSAKRINEVLDTEPCIVGGPVKVNENGLAGEVEFRNVSFKYPGAADYVLHDVSFTAKRGETVAFIGSTGSGKTSLISLVPRFYDATEGEVLVNGVNVKEYELRSLYNILGYVPQKSVLLKGTVSSNVALGDNGRGGFSEDGVKAAVGIAQGAEFVENMDGAYGAEISQGGSNISGGQKQRLSIARAIYRQPEIYIFDDSFSALDYKTDKELRKALKRETEGVTSLIVAQRIGTIMDADRIIVLEEGKVVGMGTHKELLAECEVYREIAESSMSEEEFSR